MAVDTPKDAIPGYLLSVSILEPEGNLVAEVLSRVDELGSVYRKRTAIKLGIGGITGCIALAVSTPWLLPFLHTPWIWPPFKMRQSAVLTKI